MFLHDILIVHSTYVHCYKTLYFYVTCNNNKKLTERVKFEGEFLARRES